MRFSEKTLMITGGAKGIGLATARRFAAEGAKIALVDIDEAALKLAEKELKSLTSDVISIVADAGNPEQIREAVARTIDQSGGIDIAVSGAGRGSPNVDFFDVEDADWDAVLKVNLTGGFILGKAVAKHMIATGREGAIIFISSVGAVLGVPTQAPYCVSKAGIGMLTKTMALSLAPHNIRVNSVGPGPIRTAMTEAVIADDALHNLMLSRTPLGRFGEADEVAGAVSFLASADAGFMTGQTIYPDGGRLALNYVTMPTA
ncbi:MAG: SDR family NAD(P)-dependent oxidoreductase [Parasphingorhabdus sp.]|uniref:SDR family NAD(P)-dependent oxidoreductase n=1 Tax=Parasphingorhabdus sp. TaxID=2709688 RepID=UPI0030012E18